MTNIDFSYTGPDPEVNVGPYEDGYVYRIGTRISVKYHNAASARNAARAKSHFVNGDGRLEPDYRLK